MIFEYYFHPVDFAMTEYKDPGRRILICPMNDKKSRRKP